MNPKINGVPGNAPRIEGGQRPGETRSSGNQPAASAPVPDQVSLTDTARLMVRLGELLADLPTVDRERVETIKQAIADGSYTVDTEKVAAEVLRMELDLNLR